MPTHDATEFYNPWEAEVDSYESLTDFISETYVRWSAQTRVFAWRGAMNATWSFHSSLYRRLWWSNPASIPDERRLYAREGDLLKTAHRWGLHRGESGRLSILEQLAMMQHYGAPTRLIDVAFNPLIATWFAVQEDSDNDQFDGRLFAIDVTTRLISEVDQLREWEDVLVRPWKPDGDDSISPAVWRTGAWAWKPPGFFGRISKQNGGFLFGGVPGAMLPPEGPSPFQVPRGPNPADGKWTIGEVRKNTSVALRFHKADARAGGVSATGQPAYTVRIHAAAKPEIRKRLEGLYGYDTSSLYGDYPGFAAFATPDLPIEPAL